ncbi:hypothetical protein TCE0_015r01632 [Talaromyces pinophilus]|uniref:Phosphoenolpyruvate phosphomutase n=1 Tax=Talaromyces pinophilus TaxID=128442 RepID=A0A6V8H080_TALPI|nr:hypothetical protein TCE0_015r01632 [Talaromyces pinophilus]
MARQASTVALRRLLNKSKPAIAMASHNPLNANLAAEAGFNAVWVSGFELSASYAVPDASLLPMSTHLEMTRSIAQSIPDETFPIVVDVDTGFGNAINVAYIIPRFEAAGAAAVVIEDKHFPKDSSLRANGRQELVTVEEFQGKIAAAKALSHSMLIIARTEALIAGLGQEEAQRRARAYVEAGADAILIHSKKSTPEEILSFCRAWPGEQVPLVLVPTSYPQLSFTDIAALGKDYQNDYILDAYNDLGINTSDDIGRAYGGLEPYPKAAPEEDQQEATTASYENLVNSVAGSIVALDNYSPTERLRDDGRDVADVPALDKWSDVVALEWQKYASGGADLSHVFRTNIQNENTKEIILSALMAMGRTEVPLYPGVTVEVDASGTGQYNNSFFAHLGPYHGAGPAYLLAQH